MIFTKSETFLKEITEFENSGYNESLKDIKSTIPTIVELLIAEIEKVELKVYDRNIKPAVIQFYKDAVQATKEVIINDLLKQK